mgnify:CR=1 FL=1
MATNALACARALAPGGRLAYGVWVCSRDADGCSSASTSSASALCLFYVAPLWAVPMGMIVNSDGLHARTLVAMAVALGGILLIFAPDVLACVPGVCDHSDCEPETARLRRAPWPV